MMDYVCVAAVDCLMKCVISAHNHSLHVKPIITIYNIRHVCLQHLPHVHVYVYIHPMAYFNAS